MSKWKHIDCAPRDGTEILVAANLSWHGWVMEIATNVGDRWTSAFEPTHWRKKPMPPKDD